MKIISKITATVLVIMMILLNSMALAVENVTGTVNTETLRLRKEPSVESIVIDLLSKDDKVEILEEKDGWYKVKFKDYTGYVSKEFISTSGKVQSSESQENETQENETQENNSEGTVEVKQKEAIINTDAKIYMLPLINANVISNAKQNTQVTIISIAGGWAYVSTDEVNGWIRLDKLSIKETNVSESNTNSSESNSNAETANNSENTNNTKANESEKENEQEEFQSKNVYIKASAANIRSSATTNSEVITTLSQNTVVKIVGEEDDWYKVEVSGKNGYILKTLVSDTKVEVTSRSATPTRATTQTQVTTQEETTTQSQTTNNEGTTTQGQQSTTQTTSSKGEEVVAYAKQYLGCKYVYAGAGPSVFDCSGFTMYVYKHFGYSMGHSAVTQAGVGSYVSKSNLQPGDLVIFNNESNTSIGHVGIYVGSGSFIHASSGSGKVIISSLSNAYYSARYVTGRRIF